MHAIHPCSGALGDHEHHTPRDPLAGAHRRQPAGSYQPLPRSAHTWRPQPKVRRPRDETAAPQPPRSDAPPKSNNRPQDPMASSSSPGQGGSTWRLARGDDVTWQPVASTAWKQAWLVLLQLKGPRLFSFWLSPTTNAYAPLTDYSWSLFTCNISFYSSRVDKETLDIFCFEARGVALSWALFTLGKHTTKEQHRQSSSCD